jgi:hypothetical protein
MFSNTMTSSLNVRAIKHHNVNMLINKMNEAIGLVVDMPPLLRHVG